MNHLQENTTSIIELFNYHRLNLEISKIIMSMSIDASEDNESLSNDIEEDITPIENAFPNLSPIFCNLRPYETNKKSSSNKSLSSTLSTSSSSESQVWSLSSSIAPFSLYSNTNIPYYSFSNKNFKYKIYLDNILSGVDQRTTVMIRHIPNKYSLRTLTEELNHKFKNKYDIVYLPIDYTNNCNLGFAFINFIHPLYIVDFYDTFSGKKWKRFLSTKRCELAYAKIQGRNDLLIHFEKGVVMNSQPREKKPLILSISAPYPKFSFHIRHKIKIDQHYPHVHYEMKKDYLFIEYNVFLC